MKRALLTLAAVLAVFALPAPAATASHIPAPPGARRGCSEGITYTNNPFTNPSSIVSWWTVNSCDHFQSPKLQDNGGSVHYGDAWRTAVNALSTASSPNQYGNGKAWIRYKATSAGQKYCFRVWPTRGTSWSPC